VLTTRSRENADEVHSLLDHASVRSRCRAGQATGRDRLLHRRQRRLLARHGPKTLRTGGGRPDHDEQRRKGDGQSGETPRTDHPAILPY
jgi:hypothetical protein